MNKVKLKGDTKYKLLRLGEDDDITHLGSGYVLGTEPCVIELGHDVSCGSVSSRDGWTTSPVVAIAYYNNETDTCIFSTNNNLYIIKPIDELLKKGAQ